MGNPNPDIIMRKAVIIGYSISSTVRNDPPPLVTELIMELVLASGNSSGSSFFGSANISFVDCDKDYPIGSCFTQGDEIVASDITLPLQEFDSYMAILQYSNPAVLEFFFRPGPKGSIEHDIAELRLAGGWGVATQLPSDRRPASPRRSPIRRSTASQGGEQDA